MLNFIQRSPAPTGKGLPLSSVYSGFDVRSTAAFKRLDQEAETFRLSIPREYRSPTAQAKDPRLFLLHAIAHTATILLHESSATAEVGCVSLAKTLQSARAILGAMYELLGTAYSPTQLPPFITYCWIIAGRTLVRDYALRLVGNQFEGVQPLKEDIRNLIAAMRATRTPCADTSAKALEALLNSPELCLPVRNAGGMYSIGASTGVDCCGGPDEVFKQARQEGGFSGAAVLRAGEPGVAVVTPPDYPSNGSDYTRVVDRFGVIKENNRVQHTQAELDAGRIPTGLEALLAGAGAGAGVISPVEEVAEADRFQDLGGSGERSWSQ